MKIIHKDRKTQWYSKIKKTISSINTTEQAPTTIKLIHFFGKRYDDLHMKGQLSESLQNKLNKL